MTGQTSKNLTPSIYRTVIDYRISRRVKEQFDAFMSGFGELIPQDLVNVFDERELELLIGGMSEIDVCVLSASGFSLCV